MNTDAASASGSRNNNTDLGMTRAHVGRYDIGGEVDSIANIQRAFSGFFNASIGSLSEIAQERQKQEDKVAASTALVDYAKNGAFDEVDGTKKLKSIEGKPQAYIDTWKAAVANDLGHTLGSDFGDDIRELPPETDIMSFKQEWYKKRMADGNGGIGTGDALVDGRMIAVADPIIDEKIANWRINASKVLDERRWNTFYKSETDTYADTPANQSMVLNTLQSAQAQFPGNPLEGKKRAMGIFQDLAANSPAQAQSIVTSLRKLGPEQGIPKTFIDGLEETALGKTREIRSYSANQRMNNWELGWIESPPKSGEDFRNKWVELKDMGREIDPSNSRYMHAIKQYTTSLQQYVEQEALFNEGTNQIMGQTEVKPKMWAENDFMIEWLKRSGVDAFKQPEEAAKVAQRVGAIPPSYKAFLSNQLISGDPATAAKAASFYDRVINARGNNDDAEKLALSMMDQDAKELYLEYRGYTNNMGVNMAPTDVFANLAERRKNAKPIEGKNTKQLFGKSEDTYSSEVKSGLENAFGVGMFTGDGPSSARMSPGLMATMEREVKLVAAQKGRTDIKNVAEELVKARRIGVNLTQDLDGTWQYSVNNMPDQVPVLNEYGRPTGEYKPVVHPGKAEAELGRRDIKSIVENIDGYNIGKNGVSLSNAFGERMGTWMVTDNGSMIAFGPGSKFKFFGEPIVFHDNMSGEDVAKHLNSRLEQATFKQENGLNLPSPLPNRINERIRWVVLPGTDSVALAYQFGDDATSIEQRMKAEDERRKSEAAIKASKPDTFDPTYTKVPFAP